MARLTEEQRQNIIILYNSHTMKEISVIMGCSQNTVFNVLKQHGIKKPNAKRKIEPQDVINDYQNGFTSVKFLAKKYNCSRTSINIILRDVERVKRAHKPNKKEIEIINDIKQMSVTGENLSEIAKRYNVSRQYVHKLKKNYIKT